MALSYQPIASLFPTQQSQGFMAHLLILAKKSCDYY